MYSYDFIIVGGGVIGLSLALNLKNRLPDSNILITEKEKVVASHTSGRNSGVLHTGFYYTSDSLKARFTREGTTAMRQYCQDKKLQIN